MGYFVEFGRSRLNDVNVGAGPQKLGERGLGSRERSCCPRNTPLPMRITVLNLVAV